MTRRCFGTAASGLPFTATTPYDCFAGGSSAGAE